MQWGESNIVPSRTDLLFLILSDFFHVFRGNVLLKSVLNRFHKGINLVAA